MASIARQSRPWRLSSSRPAPLLLAALNPRVTSPNAALPNIVQQRGAKSKTVYGKQGGRTARQQTDMQVRNRTILMPDTLVVPPFWRYPKNPVLFSKFLWQIARYRFRNILNNTVTKLQAKPSFLTKSKLQSGRNAVVPTAKALHQLMSEAVAAGDKDTLREVCAPELYDRLAGIVDARPKGERTVWELVKYDSPLVYPRLADFRVVTMPIAENETRLIKQAIVSIKSTQRVAKYDDTKGGIEIPGSVKETTMIENIVLVGEHDKVTYQELRSWKIWGTLPETTYEDALEIANTIQYMTGEK